MNYCPQCGSPLTSQNIKFCPECGCNLKALQRVDMECPDCGMVFDRQAIPNECPSCGCPSERFKVHEDDAEINAELITTPENEQPENEQPKKTSIKPVLITLLFVIAGCLFIYYVTTPSSSSSSSSSATSATASEEQYDADIDELDNLVSEIVRLEYQYLETKDESIAERGEKLCERLRELSHSLENAVNEGKISIEQQERINEILERLPH